jgi:hypothetical protein
VLAGRERWATSESREGNANRQERHQQCGAVVVVSAGRERWTALAMWWRGSGRAERGGWCVNREPGLDMRVGKEKTWSRLVLREGKEFFPHSLYFLKIPKAVNFPYK